MLPVQPPDQWLLQWNPVPERPAASICLCPGDSNYNAQQSANQCNDDRFHQELEQDRAGLGTKCLTDTDLLGSFCYDTSIIFITPIPPTIKDIAATSTTTDRDIIEYAINFIQ